MYGGQKFSLSLQVANQKHTRYEESSNHHHGPFGPKPWHEGKTPHGKPANLRDGRDGDPYQEEVDGHLADVQAKPRGKNGVSST